MHPPRRTMNRNRDRGIRAENEACRLLEAGLGYPYDTVRRRANKGVRVDVGGLIGVPDTCVQVTRIGPQGFVDLGRIAFRARTKAADCTIQQGRRSSAHGVVLMRLDGTSNRPARWRAIVDHAQLISLGASDDWCHITGNGTQGLVIRDCPEFGPTRTWLYAPGPTELWVSTLEGWLHSWLAAMRTRTIA